MNIAVVGAGFTGLSAALKLSKLKHKVTIFEKENTVGGLAATFKEKSWKWSLEKHYHHWFTTDSSVVNIIKELHLDKYLLCSKTLTSIYYKNTIHPFDSPRHVLSFPHLDLLERARVGLVLFYLKLISEIQAIDLERTTSYKWLEKWFGENAFSILWQPLILNKFGQFAKSVNMSWFWARIKKRTPSFYYLEGGYKRLLTSITKEIEKRGGKFVFNTPFEEKRLQEFDKIIITTPSSVFTKIFSSLPKEYSEQLNQIQHLHALSLLLVSNKKFLEKTYWLNINDRNFPFAGIVQHTNMISAKYFNNKHLTWIANYLPSNHPYFKKTAEELLKIYLPYLQKINPNFNFKFENLNLKLFVGRFAQPVFPVNYSRQKPDFKTPIPNVYLANMDMIYPWDRGTNYAVELGFKVASLVDLSKRSSSSAKGEQD